LLEDVDSTQTTLFHDTRMHKRNDLNRTLDRIDDRFGQGAVTRATQHSTERAGLSMQVKRGDGE
ncbi:MAG: hypothetical protein VYD25_13720, partial [Pseudomonadota bacterium]|nr:hypothetical protein [Pseudomonadota bacterium]